MSQNFSLKTYEGRTFYLLLLLIIALIISPALMSIATGLLFINYIASFNKDVFKIVNLSSLPILSASILFFLSLVFFAFTPDYQKAAQQLWLRLPWLALPFSIAAIKKPGKDAIDFLVAFLIFIISISSVWVLINYFYNYDFYTAQMIVAKPIPTPLNHIRYSLMLSFACIASIFFFVKNDTRISPYDRYFFAFTSIFLFATLHILAVRSGLFSFYLAGIFLIIYFTFKTKKWWLLPILVGFSLLLPFLAYKNIQSFTNKIDYMRYDFEQIVAGNVGHNSDARRLQSYEVAWALSKEKPILGHGLGQVEASSLAYYEANLPLVETQNRKIPHNQFLFNLVEMGVFGFLGVLLIFILPFSQKSTYKNTLYIAFIIIMGSSCLVENTFESQQGMMFFLVFASLLLKNNERE